MDARNGQAKPAASFQTVFGHGRGPASELVPFTEDGGVDFDQLYRMRPIPTQAFPTSPRIVFLGQEWAARGELHWTVFDATRLAPLLTDGQGLSALTAYRMLEAQALLVEQAHLTYAPAWGQMRVACREDRRSLIQMLLASGLEELYAQMSANLGVVLPAPPAHVTLYTAPGRQAIGLALPEEMDALSRPLSAEEVRDLGRARRAAPVG